MNIRRILTGIIGFIIVAVILIYSNTYVFDFIISLLALIMIDEYCKSFNKEKYKPILWISYVSCLFIFFIHIIPSEYIKIYSMSLIPILIVLLFVDCIVTKMKINIVDISITIFGILYVVGLLSFISMLRGEVNGLILVWYIFMSAWGTDILAFSIGRPFGKHKFTNISPKKTIEGCIAGIAGSIIFVLIYTMFINKYLNININYYIISLLAVIWSILGQIGDLAASTIKRFSNIKDFSNLLPGHGGMLDRFDSVMFIAPFAYILLMMINII